MELIVSLWSHSSVASRSVANGVRLGSLRQCTITILCSIGMFRLRRLYGTAEPLQPRNGMNRATSRIREARLITS
jgi:hypothetical protein